MIINNKKASKAIKNQSSGHKILSAHSVICHFSIKSFAKVAIGLVNETFISVCRLIDQQVACPETSINKK